MIKDPTVCVAIVTARRNEHTSYDRWRDLRHALLTGVNAFEDLPLWDDRGRCAQPALNGEFMALLMSCLNEPAIFHHVEYQLRALALQTRKPDDILVVSRVDWPDLLTDGPLDVRWVQPMLSTPELDAQPLSALAASFEVDRMHGVPLGCNDKNTAVVLCSCDILVMLDDCCLPTPGLIEAAVEVCSAGDVLLLGHRKISFDGTSKLRLSESNWNPDALEADRNVFGVFAAPIKHILAVNGWNTNLDGYKADLDVELKMRMDRYLKMVERKYVARRSARVYEIDHEFPWNCEQRPDGWREFVGYKASGPSLEQLRKEALAQLEKQGAVLEEQEAQANGEADEEDEED